MLISPYQEELNAFNSSVTVIDEIGTNDINRSKEVINTCNVDALQFLVEKIKSEFAGEEALWENNQPFWSMNYIGRILANGFNGEFLKEALLNVPSNIPYRGPSEYKNGSFTYKCAVEGGFEWLHGYEGYEEIFNGNTKVYECMFHGGAIE